MEKVLHAEQYAGFTVTVTEKHCTVPGKRVLMWTVGTEGKHPEVVYVECTHFENHLGNSYILQHAKEAAEAVARAMRIVADRARREGYRNGMTDGLSAGAAIGLGFEINSAQEVQA